MYRARIEFYSTFFSIMESLNPKLQALNNKWLDKLTTLSQVEG
jgi:hypothetical protein